MPVERIRPPGWLKPMNKVLMVLLRLGVPISRAEAQVVLTVPGRKSGRPRSTPITPMHIEGKRYVVNCYPGANWVSNVRMVELPPREARPILRAFPAAVPAGIQLMKRAGVLTDGTPDELEGLAGRLPVFRIDPIT